MQFSEFVQHLCLFINAHLAIKRANTVAVIAAHPTFRHAPCLCLRLVGCAKAHVGAVRSRIVYPSSHPEIDTHDTGKWQPLQHVNDALVCELELLFSEGMPCS